MTAKTAWDKILKHCRYLGIPVNYGQPNKIGTLNGHKIQILATTNQKIKWENNFKGAWTITLYFSKTGSITWNRVALLLHEMGHVLDYRDNMVIRSRTIIQDEKAATRYGLKVTELLELNREKIEPRLNQFVDEYKLIAKPKEPKYA